MPAAPQAHGSLIERIDLVLENRIDDLARATAALDDLARRHHFDASLLADLQVALDEVLSNIVRHAWNDAAEHRFDVRLDVHERAIVITTVDSGRAFDPVAAWVRRRHDVPPAHVPGGRGLRLIFSLMDDVRYARTGGCNRLEIVRPLAMLTPD